MLRSAASSLFRRANTQLSLSLPSASASASGRLPLISAAPSRALSSLTAAEQQQQRLKSSLARQPLQDEDLLDASDLATAAAEADTAAVIAPSSATATATATATTTTSTNTASASTASNKDLTFDRTKSGTPSPWAVFDAWGAGADEISHPDPLSDQEKLNLSPPSVKIPLTESERSQLPDESDILQAYDHLLRGKSSVHFGYPYNLMFDFTELTQFLKYSINNLGDPFVPSNYGVHSRQFECSVIDFFAQLWKMPPNEYWGYGTLSCLVAGGKGMGLQASSQSSRCCLLALSWVSLTHSYHLPPRSFL